VRVSVTFPVIVYSVFSSVEKYNAGRAVMLIIIARSLSVVSRMQWHDKKSLSVFGEKIRKFVQLFRRFYGFYTEKSLNSQGSPP